MEDIEDGIAQDDDADNADGERDGELDGNDDADDADTPALSETASTASSSSSSLSPPPTKVPERPLTRRQRKMLGLPNVRPAISGSRSAGKIVIPGGRYKNSMGARKVVTQDEEWQRNGTGRVDVRGFRELRI